MEQGATSLHTPKTGFQCRPQDAPLLRLGLHLLGIQGARK